MLISCYIFGLLTFLVSGLLSYSIFRMARKMLIDGELDKPNQEEAHYDFDLFVIGAGSGGVRASRFSAQYGAKVQILENAVTYIHKLCTF